MRRRYGFHASTEALRAWAAEPTFAPDCDRKPTCLEALLQERTVVAEGEADSVEEDVAIAPENQDSEDLYANEGRLRWFVRVIQTSYRDGGLPMVVKRAAKTFMGR